MEKDNITYEHRHSNFIEAKTHAMKLLGMLKGCIAMNGEQVDIDVGAYLPILAPQKCKVSKNSS